MKINKNNENEEVQLFSSIDEYEIIQISTILEENKIPFIKKQNGSGSYMSLYMGQSIQEKQIIVNQKDYEKAVELISIFINNKEEKVLDENNKNEEDEGDENIEKSYILIRRWLGILVIGLPILVIIIIVMVSMIMK